MSADYRLEPFSESEWDAVYRLADAAIPFDLDGNRQTIDRRKSFDDAHYTRRHYDIFDSQNGQIIAYGAVEQQADDLRSFRMFIILLSGDLWESAGERLYRQLMSDLRAFNARRVWWREYADDVALLNFVLARGFVETDRVFDLRAPRQIDSAPLVARGYPPSLNSDEQQVIVRATEIQVIELAEQAGFRRAFGYVRLEKSLA